MIEARRDAAMRIFETERGSDGLLRGRLKNKVRRTSAAGDGPGEIYFVSRPARSWIIQN
jgi:hypothetical protein